MTRMNAWTLVQFTEIFADISVEDKEVPPRFFPQL